jgi:hypothetical protein
MRELYLDDIPLGSSNDDYENFLGKKFPSFMGRRNPFGGGTKGTPIQGNVITPTINTDYCEQQWQDKSRNVRYASKQALVDARNEFMQECRPNRKKVGEIPRPFPVSEINVDVQDQPVYVPKGTPVSRSFANPNIVKPSDEPQMRDLSEIVERRNSLGGITRTSPITRFGNKINLGIQGIFGGLFRKKIKRQTPEIKTITIRAREIWEKDMESWSQALKRAEKQLVQEGEVTPTTYLNFDSQGNAVGYEHETYD